MPSVDEGVETVNKSNQSPNPSEVMLSLATAPFLGGLLIGQAFIQVLIESGEASEEMFRGDRLPVLHLSPSETFTPSKTESIKTP